jgi:GTP cyclohydrolase I
MNSSQIEKGVRLILKGLNCDTKDRNFAETPERVARAYAEIFTPKETEYATFEEQYNDFILLRGYQIWSLCPHHLLPVKFTVHVAYIPEDVVLGLSKLARLVAECNRGPVLQEGFTSRIVEKLGEVLGNIRGAAAMVAGEHGCMQIRGVRTHGDVVTYSMSGEFKQDQCKQDLFFNLINARR